jgi:excisionase family DNA binding protein
MKGKRKGSMRFDISPESESSAGENEAHGNQEVETLLTVREAADFLKVPVSWIYEHTRQGCEDPLPVVRVGKYLRFFSRDILDYLEAMKKHRRH